MVEPISLLISLALGASIGIGIVGAITIVIYIVLKIIDLVQWFRNKRRDRVSEEQQNLIAGTVGAKIKQGKVVEIDCGLFNEETEKYNMIQYLYNEKEDKIVEARAIETNSIDNNLEEKHNQALQEGSAVIYNNI